MKWQYKEKFIFIVLFVMLSLALVACATKHTMKGTYEISYTVMDGYSLPDDNFTIEIDGDPNSVKSNCFASLNWYEYSDFTFGYVTKLKETPENIVYKFWVTGHSGNIFSDDLSYFYLWYDPGEDMIKLDGGELQFYFNKSR